jgi:NADPH:quinone reductase-like Zn-dependent oxidoreductase
LEEVLRALQIHEYGPSSVLTVNDVPEPHAGPGTVRIAVRAAGVTPGEVALRAGLMKDLVSLALPHTLGVDAAGVVDEVGEGVTGVAVGDAVFGVVDIKLLGGAAAEYAVLVAWQVKPESLSWEQAGGAGANVETATRTLAQLGVKDGDTLLIEGAAGGVGSVAVQLAVASGATVIGTAGEQNQDFLRGLGAIPTTYGDGLTERVAALAPGGVDAVLDCAGKGSLGELVKIAGGPERVITIADFRAHEHGVLMSHTGGPDNPATPNYDGFAVAAALADEGRFTVPVHAAFPLEEAAAAHELSATGHARGKIVLTLQG